MPTDDDLKEIDPAIQAKVGDCFEVSSNEEVSKGQVLRTHDGWIGIAIRYGKPAIGPLGTFPTYETAVDAVEAAYDELNK